MENTPNNRAFNKQRVVKPKIDVEIYEDGSPLHKKKFFKWPPNKYAAIILVVLLFLIGGVIVIFHHKPKKIEVSSVKNIVKSAPKPTTVPSTLSGLLVAPSVNNTPVTGVMIENSTFARPQSGLSQAEVVFEAIAEGGITRFLALFQNTAPSSVGPIRSVRPYYEQWALGFDAALAHVGGSPEALSDMKSWGVKDLDQFANAGSYSRISTRAAPHNVYTSIQRLNQLETAKGYGAPKYTGFPRKAEQPMKIPAVNKIYLNISGPVYNVSYTYNPKINSYDRVLAGQPHLDANTSFQISPKVVIAMVIPYSLETDGYHSDYGVIGSGQAYVFEDGNEISGTWAKSGNSAQIVFTDAAGKVIKLDPGQTWITAVIHTTDVQYSK